MCTHSCPTHTVNTTSTQPLTTCTYMAVRTHVVKGTHVCSEILDTHDPTHCSHNTARKKAPTNMHIHVCRHRLPDTYGHTHITHKPAHTSGRPHTRANTRGRIHVWEHPHHTQAGTHKWRDTYSHTHLTHTRANTLHTLILS